MGEGRKMRNMFNDAIEHLAKNTLDSMEKK
jgi:hypothetical protein